MEGREGGEGGDEAVRGGERVDVAVRAGLSDGEIGYWLPTTSARTARARRRVLLTVPRINRADTGRALAGASAR